MWWLGGVVLVLSAALWGPVASRVEQPSYEVIESQGDIEIRDYAPMIVAETEVSGEREAAIRDGFRAIADYIFGNNGGARKVAMTAPVMQQAGEKIAMTAPVTLQGEGQLWQVRFVMPARDTMETLPLPRNPAVRLRQVAGRRCAVIRFSGLAAADSLERYTQELNEFLRARRLQALSLPTYAFYNPPWTLPFLRRNEVMVDVGGT